MVLGKTGGGKSTVANHVLGNPKYSFKVKDTLIVTGSCTHKECTMTGTDITVDMIDTIGLFDREKSNAEVLKTIKTFIQTDIPDRINLILFNWKQGRYSEEEKKTFDLLLDNFDKEISEISALVVTNCDTKNDKGRERVKTQLLAHAETAKIAERMKRGIYCVGFPNESDMIESMLASMASNIKKDEITLRNLVEKSTLVKLKTKRGF